MKKKASLGIEFYNVPFFHNLTDFLNDTIPVDVITIATPNGLHASQALEVLQAKKHVVIEKPMALSKKDAKQIIDKASDVSRQVFVVKQNRYSPPSIWLKELIENDILGKIFTVKLDCFWNRDERYYTDNSWHGNAKLDGGTLFTQFSHFIDIMYWLFGDIKNISGIFRDFNHQTLTDFEDTGLVNFEFVNGGLGNLNYSTAVWQKNLESTMTVIAENGVVKIGGQYMDCVDICRIKDYQMPALPPTNAGNDYGAYKGSAANHHYVIENVIDTLQGRTYATTNGLEGMKVVDIIERIYQYK